MDVVAVQETAFKQVKEELSKPTTLAHYDPEAPTKISADASSFGLGAAKAGNTMETNCIHFPLNE